MFEYYYYYKEWRFSFLKTIKSSLTKSNSMGSPCKDLNGYKYKHIEHVNSVHVNKFTPKSMLK